MTVSNSVLNRLNAAVEQYVEDEQIDFNEGQAGGGRLMPEGNALGRLVEYIEYGPQLSKTFPDKPPVNKFKLGFAIWGKGKNGETYHTVEGGKMVPGMIRSKQVNVVKDLNTNSAAYKLFKRLNPEKSAKHFAQLLNHTFIIPIIHNESGTGDQKKVYANIDHDNIRQAVDPLTNEPYAVPEIEDESTFKLFIWSRPSKEDWESLFIEGKNDEGKSKNFIQDTILSSPAFPGSALDILLSGGTGVVTDLPDIDEPEPEVEEPKPEPKELATKPKKEKKADKPAAGSDAFGLPNL